MKLISKYDDASSSCSRRGTACRDTGHLMKAVSDILAKEAPEGSPDKKITFRQFVPKVYRQILDVSRIVDQYNPGYEWAGAPPGTVPPHQLPPPDCSGYVSYVLSRSLSDVMGQPVEVHGTTEGFLYGFATVTRADGTVINFSDIAKPTQIYTSGVHTAGFDWKNIRPGSILMIGDDYSYPHHAVLYLGMKNGQPMVTHCSEFITDDGQVGVDTVAFPKLFDDWSIHVVECLTPELARRLDVDVRPGEENIVPDDKNVVIPDDNSPR